MQFSLSWLLLTAWMVLLIVINAEGKDPNDYDLIRDVRRVYNFLTLFNIYNFFFFYCRSSLMNGRKHVVLMAGHVRRKSIVAHSSVSIIGAWLFIKKLQMNA